MGFVRAGFVTALPYHALQGLEWSRLDVLVYPLEQLIDQHFRLVAWQAAEFRHGIELLAYRFLGASITDEIGDMLGGVWEITRP